MARDTEPMTDSELDAFDETINEQAEELREALAEDLGGDPEGLPEAARRRWWGLITGAPDIETVERTFDNLQARVDRYRPE